MPGLDLSGLPGWAQILAIVVLAISMGIAGVLARYGFIKGKDTPIDKSAGGAQVAAVIVDPTALNLLREAVSGEGGLTAVLKLQTEALLEMTKMGRELSDLVGQHVADQRLEREERVFDEKVEERAEEMAERIIKKRRRPTRAPPRRKSVAQT